MVVSIKNSFNECIRFSLWRRYKLFQKMHYISLLSSIVTTIFLIHRVFTAINNPSLLIYLIIIYYIVAISLNLYGLIYWKYVFKHFKNSKYTHSEKLVKKIIFVVIYINPLLIVAYYHSRTEKCDPLMVTKNKHKEGYTQYLIHLLEINHNVEQNRLIIFNEKVLNKGIKNTFMKNYLIIMFKQYLGIIISIMFIGGGYFILFSSNEISNLYIAIASQLFGLLMFSTFIMFISGLNECKNSITKETYLLALIQTKFLLKAIELSGGVLTRITSNIHETYKEVFLET